MHWISVEDRMPALYEGVLIHRRVRGRGRAVRPILAALFNGTYWHTLDRGHLVPRDAVTHWMPLPEPPEAGV